MARPASLSSNWLPAYGWWPHPSEVSATVILTPYHAAVEPEARFHFTIRGYLGDEQPVWEYEVGELALGEECGVRLSDLDIPEPPVDGGILEVHGVRLDKQPKRGVGFIGQWIDAETADGGGYVIPTIPIRAQGKLTQRDDLQVVPGVEVTRETSTELVLLNIIDEPTTVKLVVADSSGMTAENTRTIEIPPYTPWRGSLNRFVPRARRLLEPDHGIGSLAIYSTHRLLPYFGYRRNGGPITCLDHTAPLFA